MKKITDKQLKEIIKDCSFEIEGKQFRNFS